MPVKKKKVDVKKVKVTSKSAKKAVKKTAKKPARKPVAPVQEVKPVQKGFVCEVCGYRLIIDKDCGCAEEHVILCCGQQMKKFDEGT